MKKWAVCAAISLALIRPASSDSTRPQTADLALPESIRATLNEEYPDWKLAPVTAQIQLAYRQHKVNHSPSLAAGDFDRDGQRDYAVQIVLPTPGQEEQIILAFMARADHFEETVLQSMGIDGAYSLWVTRTSHAQTGADPEKPVVKDVLMVLGGPMGDTIYSYDDGKFHDIPAFDNSEHPDRAIPRAAPLPDPAPEKAAP